ncbi:MAG: tRNA (5-methylaminomethyl-2-thiouridine)(34)-methyltransferase MnmD [Alphaproteobacteria bacterium]|nr:tRNA (5-methylaminomethyl-2-thiouridine)(34)-methyltransferase MnmD [Alphaproteobacteria bacterium]
MSKHPLSWSEDAVPYSKQFDDHFFSQVDGRGETGHVFLKGNGLPERWMGATQTTIGELGFGTGLNFLETWRQWTETRPADGHLNFVSFEGFPLKAEEIRAAMAPWPDLKTLCDEELDHWHQLKPGLNQWQMDAQTRLVLVQADVADGLALWEGAADAWYLDGFAPARNPDMWSADLMRGVFARTAPGGSFASYTSAGWVRRNLEEAGFEVNRVPGFGRKRHMITGCKPQNPPPS